MMLCYIYEKIERVSIGESWWSEERWNDGGGRCRGAVQWQQTMRDGVGKIHGTIKASQKW